MTRQVSLNKMYKIINENEYITRREVLSKVVDVLKLQLLTCKSGQATRHLHIHRRKKEKQQKKRERSKL